MSSIQYSIQYYQISCQYDENKHPSMLYKGTSWQRNAHLSNFVVFRLEIPLESYGSILAIVPVIRISSFRCSLPSPPLTMVLEKHRLAPIIFKTNALNNGVEINLFH
jgi:hypothetical protein